ncbi:MAG: FtsX-like permease family protein [Bacteroidales bacterium]|jgi:putative ABC transport system permease protein|nr:FtsX-like permease family protein [Bacteroidales bacterium]
MIKFLLKGLARDKSRSRLPVIAVAIGVMLTVLMHAYIVGFMNDSIEMNARFQYGHLKVMTKPYAENANQMPNDLALLEAGNTIDELKNKFPGIEWAHRIQFGGLIDVPDETGETKAQGPFIGIGLDLLSGNTLEPERLNMTRSLVRGKMPSRHGEVLISEQFASKMQVNPGREITFIGTTMNGSMTIHNFIVAGTLSFGNELLDRGTVIADIEDARIALDMHDASGEIVGFFEDGFYNNDLAEAISEKYNSGFSSNDDEYAPVMKSLSQQGSMGQYVRMSEVWANYVAMIFIIAMSLVLWNAGLLAGLRRYGEVGLRLALGENKGHVYLTLIFESIITGITGSILGTFLGLFFSWLLQKYGLDFSGIMKGATIMMPSIIRAHITPPDYYIGFIPGLLSTLIGTSLSGIGIYKRQTASLFRELEA